MLVLLGAAFLGGLFVLWLQLSTLVSVASLAVGARSFQTSLQAVAEQIGDGDYEQARADFAEVQTAADRISWSALGPHIKVLYSVPGFTIPAGNWQRLATATGDVTSSVGELLALFGDMTGENGNPGIFADGAIDIDRLEALPPRVDTIDTGIQSTTHNLSAIHTGGPLAQPLEKVRNSALKAIVPIQQAIDALVDIAPLLPDALGAHGPRRYLVAIGNQAEMRASFGAPLTLVLVEFNDGHISIPIKGQTSTELFPPLNAKVRWWGPAMNPFFPDNPRNAPMVVTNTHPSLLFSAREMAGAWGGGGFPTVDGVIALDLTAIGAALNAMGPIHSDAYGEVTGDQLGQILLIDAYAKYGQTEADARQQANQALLDELLVKLLSGEDVLSVAKAVASTAPGRHFQVWMADPTMERVVIQSGAGGVVTPPESGDWSAVYTQNGNQSKVDVFQQRNVLVTVQLAEDGSAQVNQQITLTNATPPERPAEGTFGREGYETTWLKSAYLMYVPDAATGYRVTYPDGFAVRPFRNHQQFGRGFVDDGFGHKLVRVAGWTPPGGQSAVSVSYSLPAGTFGTATTGLAYDLRSEPQAMFTPPTLTVRVTAPAGWAPAPQDGMVVTGATAELSAVQDAAVNVHVDFERSRP